jgi:DNA-binding transcriptional MerR regulator
MPQAQEVRVVRIGELALEFGLNPKTVRYYEQLGLLSAGRRSRAGYRLYDSHGRDRLRFIIKAKAIGLTLKEIGEILELRRQGLRPCAHVVTLLDRKLSDIEGQMRALAEFREELLALRHEASGASTREACVCGIIEQHALRPSARPPAPTLARPRDRRR